MPVLKRLTMNPLEMDITPPLKTRTVWCVCGTLIERKWAIMSSLRGPRYATYSNDWEYLSGTWLKQPGTLADILRGLTSPKTRRMFLSISVPYGSTLSAKNTKRLRARSPQSPTKTEQEQSTWGAVNQSVLPGFTTS